MICCSLLTWFLGFLYILRKIDLLVMWAPGFFFHRLSFAFWLFKECFMMLILGFLCELSSCSSLHSSLLPLTLLPFFLLTFLHLSRFSSTLTSSRHLPGFPIRSGGSPLCIFSTAHAHGCHGTQHDIALQFVNRSLFPTDIDPLGDTLLISALPCLAHGT